MAFYEVDPISRIEGHLGVKLEESGGSVVDAEVHGNLWRGFENFLLGRDVNDAITFTQRICGVCPVPHGQTSTYAVDAVLGYSAGHISFPGDVPAKAVHIRNLVLSAEFLMSHLTHFYHLVVLDYVQGPATPPWTPFFNDNFYHAALQNPTGTKVLPTQKPDASGGFSESVWDAGVTQYVKALRIRRLTFEAGALFAGRMPMTSCFVGGGVTNDGTEDLSGRVAKYKAIMQEVGDFIIKEHVPLVLALGVLYPEYDNGFNASASPYWGSVDSGFGAGYGNFIAWGAFPNGDITDASAASLALPGGLYITDDVCGNIGSTGSIFTANSKTTIAAQFLPGGTNAVEDCLTETIVNSHYGISSFDTDNIDASSGKAFPGDVQRTMPDRSAGYSYIKSPRWKDTPCEVGPFARQVVAGLYPVDGSTLASGYGAYYAAYLKVNGSGTTGLDPAMIGVDLAVALVRDGLAAVEVGGTTYDAAAIAGASGGTLASVYNNSDAIISGAVTGWVAGLKGGLSTMDRLRARALEALYLIQVMIGDYQKATTGLGTDMVWGGVTPGWIDSAALLTTTAGSTWSQTLAISANTNYGATEAPRGALMHYASINDSGKITAYQAIVPTTWNACPKDQNDNHGPMEKAMLGIPYSSDTSEYIDQSGNTQTTHSQLEALRVAHTYDPCIACAVH